TGAEPVRYRCNACAGPGAAGDPGRAHRGTADGARRPHARPTPCPAAVAKPGAAAAGRRAVVDRHGADPGLLHPSGPDRQLAAAARRRPGAGPGPRVAARHGTRGGAAPGLVASGGTHTQRHSRPALAAAGALRTTRRARAWGL